MNDRELLELAARAAGITIAGFTSKGLAVTESEGFWSPLRRDGDALRLALDLELIVGHDADDKLAYAQIRHPHRVFDEYYGGTGLDAYAAARRAIVRAAAAIAQEMTDAQG